MRTYGVQSNRFFHYPFAKYRWLVEWLLICTSFKFGGVLENWDGQRWLHWTGPVVCARLALKNLSLLPPSFKAYFALFWINQFIKEKRAESKCNLDTARLSEPFVSFRIFHAEAFPLNLNSVPVITNQWLQNSVSL